MSMFHRKSKRQAYWDRKQEAAKLTDKDARYYGDGGTIHDSGVIDVEIRGNVVVSVWFRCQMLPFRVHEVGNARMVEMAKRDNADLPRLTGVEVVDRRPR